jgi:hypothetical protein
LPGVRANATEALVHRQRSPGKPLSLSFRRSRRRNATRRAPASSHATRTHYEGYALAVRADLAPRLPAPGGSPARPPSGDDHGQRGGRPSGRRATNTSASTSRNWVARGREITEIERGGWEQAALGDCRVRAGAGRPSRRRQPGRLRPRRVARDRGLPRAAAGRLLRGGRHEARPQLEAAPNPAAPLYTEQLARLIGARHACHRAAHSIEVSPTAVALAPTRGRRGG